MKKILLSICFIFIFCGVCVADTKQELYELRQHMRSTVDTIENVKWIEDKSTPKNIHKNMFYVYLGQQEYSTWLRFVVGITRSDCCFFDRMLVNIDGDLLKYEFDYFDVDRKVLHDGRICERIDLLGNQYLSMLKRVGKAQKVQIRLKGQQFTKCDFILTKDQKDSIRRVVRLYEIFNKCEVRI